MEGKKMVDEKNNTGEFNTGKKNTGRKNAGDYNTGFYNKGSFNRGGFNKGNKNTGFYNTGEGNVGENNAGDFNTGFLNSGFYNIGHFNSGDGNTGFFNTDEANIRMFNKETNLKRGDISFPFWFYNIQLTEWVCYEDMTEIEKQKYPGCEIIGGYLKTYDYKEAWRKAFNEENDLVEIRKAEQLPNFDYQIFQEITGISKSDFDEKLGRIYTENKRIYFKGDLIEDE